LARADRLERILARKQPAAREHRGLAATLESPCSEQGQQIGRQHGVATPATLAAFDTNEHPLAVDIADLERGDFGDPETRAIGDAQRGTMLNAGRGAEQPGDLIRAQHGRQLARVGNADQFA
jgi:hypothetical protein